MSETKTIKPKAHNVYKDGKFVAIVYAPTVAGAIREAKNAQAKAEEHWDAELATGEDLYNAAVDKTWIINAPNTINVQDDAPDDPQTDAFSDNE